jgi:hypothetical protein
MGGILMDIRDDVSRQACRIMLNVTIDQRNWAHFTKVTL